MPDPETQVSADPTAQGEQPKAAPSEEKTGEQEVAEALAREAAEAGKPRAEGEEQPPAGQPAPPAWDAKAWEQFGHKVVSAATFAKEAPKLADGVDPATAPESMRPILEAQGYIKAEGEKPEEPPTPGAIDQGALSTLAVEILDDDDEEYEAGREEHLEAAATAEERATARREARQASADRLINAGLEALEGAGYEVEGLEGKQLDKALAAIPGLALPTDSSNRRQVARFLASVRLHVEAKAAEGPPSADVPAEIAKAREQWDKDLTGMAERKSGQERVKNGDLGTALGGGGGEGEYVPTAEELDNMPIEQAVELEKKGVLDKALANLPK